MDEKKFGMVKQRSLTSRENINRSEWDNFSLKF